MQEQSGPLSIFFARFPPTVVAEEVLALFKQYGDVVNLNLFRRWATARTTKGCGIVTFKHHAAAAAALNALNGSKMHFSNSTCAEVVVEWVDDGKVAKAMNAQAVSCKGKAGRQLGANSSSQHELGIRTQLPHPFGACTNVAWNALAAPTTALSQPYSCSSTPSISARSSLLDEANSKANPPLGALPFSAVCSTDVLTGTPPGEVPLWLDMPLTPDSMQMPPTSPMCGDAILTSAGAWSMMPQQPVQMPHFQQQHQMATPGTAAWDTGIKALLMQPAANAAYGDATISCSAACRPPVAAAAAMAAGRHYSGMAAVFPGLQERLVPASQMQNINVSCAGCTAPGLALRGPGAGTLPGTAACFLQQQHVLQADAVRTISVAIPEAHVSSLAGLMNTMACMTQTNMSLEANGGLGGFQLCVTGTQQDLLTALQLLDAAFGS